MRGFSPHITSRNFTMNNKDYLQVLIDAYRASTGGVWKVIKDDDIDTAWVSSDAENSNPIALVDYNSGEQNRADAYFISKMHNHAEEIFDEITNLRARVVDLLNENTNEVNKRIAIQNELNKIKEKR